MKEVVGVEGNEAWSEIIQMVALSASFAWMISNQTTFPSTFHIWERESGSALELLIWPCIIFHGVRSLYIRKDEKDSLWGHMTQSPLSTLPLTCFSHLGIYFIRKASNFYNLKFFFFFLGSSKWYIFANICYTFDILIVRSTKMLNLYTMEYQITRYYNLLYLYLYLFWLGRDLWNCTQESLH